MARRDGELDVGGLVLEDRGVGVHRNVLRFRADGQRKIDAECGADGEGEAGAGEVIEAGRDGVEPVTTGDEIGEVEIAVGACGGGVALAGAHFGGGDLHVGEGGVGGIDDAALDFAGYLRMGGGGREQSEGCKRGDTTHESPGWLEFAERRSWHVPCVSGGGIPSGSLEFIRF